MKFEPPVKATVNWRIQVLTNAPFRVNEEVEIVEMDDHLGGCFVYFAGMRRGIGIERFDFPCPPEGYRQNAEAYTVEELVLFDSLEKLHGAKTKALKRFEERDYRNRSRRATLIQRIPDMGNTVPKEAATKQKHKQPVRRDHLIKHTVVITKGKGDPWADRFRARQ